MVYKRRRRRQRGGNINQVKNIALKIYKKGKNVALKTYKKGKTRLNPLITRVMKTKRYWSSLGNKQKTIKQKGGGAAAAALAASMFLPMIANTLSKNKKLGF